MVRLHLWGSCISSPLVVDAVLITQLSLVRLQGDVLYYEERSNIYEWSKSKSCVCTYRVGTQLGSCMDANLGDVKYFPTEDGLWGDYL